MSEFADLPRGHFGVILADPPWHFAAWSSPTALETRQRKGSKNYGSSRGPTYETADDEEICALPVAQLAAPNCVLFMWTCWPVLERSFRVLEAWGFTYKTCAFSWMKADQYRLFALQEDVRMGLGYWTRANTEPCLLATRGKPKRLNADVRQGILEPIREHSRKPDCVHERIERLVAGPYLELFARQERPNWTVWGNQTTKFNSPPLPLVSTLMEPNSPLTAEPQGAVTAGCNDYDAQADLAGSIREGLAAIRARESSKPEHARNYNFAKRELEPGEPVTDRPFGVPG